MINLNNSRTLVTGGTGMVGKAIQKILPNATYVGSNYDLRSNMSTDLMFRTFKPTHIIHLAARVGGVKGNSDFVSYFYEDNILMNTNLLSFARRYNVKKVVSLLSTCVYPDAAYVNYPLTEDQLHLGPPHQSNYGYAYAKRMLEVQSRASNQQHGTNFVCAIPNNIYGPHDNFDIENGHVIPAMIRKFHEASINGKSVELWGDGTPRREFTSCDDIARALVILLESDKKIDVVNIGDTSEFSIREIANLLQPEFGSPEIFWNTNMPMGQFRKPSSNAKFKELFPDFEYKKLFLALSETVEWFKENYPNVRGVYK